MWWDCIYCIQTHIQVYVVVVLTLITLIYQVYVVVLVLGPGHPALLRHNGAPVPLSLPFQSPVYAFSPAHSLALG